MPPVVEPADPHDPPLLLGRTREQAILRERLAAALDGRGGLVLIGGEPGIGKSALAAAVRYEAAGKGARVFVGSCYDLTETPPYGPWIELFGRFHPEEEGLSLPPLFSRRGTRAAATSQAALFEENHAFLEALARRQPLVLVLEDLHWADPASLDLLRILARTLTSLPILMIVTYRSNELTRHHPLYVLLPVLIREAAAARFVLQPLPDDAIHALVTARYALNEADAARLVAYLQERAEGNPFVVGELLQAMEEERLLRQTSQGWEVGDVALMRLPPFLRQVIAGRVVRLGEEAVRLLTVAAVIGQEVPFDLWAAVSQCDMETLLAVVERAEEAHLLDETPDGALVRFPHALIREALYEAVIPARRRQWHQQVATAFMAFASPDPDAVAYHLRQAGDPRAVQWLVRAGERAERTYAWISAADRFMAAAALLERDEYVGAAWGWLIVRLTWLRRWEDPGGGIGLLDNVLRLATDLGDRALAASALNYRGIMRCRTHDFRRGLADLTEGVTQLDALSNPDSERVLVSDNVMFDLDQVPRWGNVVMWFAYAGRYPDAFAIAERLFALENAVPEVGGRANLHTLHYGLGFIYAALGQPEKSAEEFDLARRLQQQINRPGAGQSAIDELEWSLLPYRADQVAARERLAAVAEETWASLGGLFEANRSARVNRLPLLLIEGAWAEARQLALAAREEQGLTRRRFLAMRSLAALATWQGERDLAWAMIREDLPDGLATQPGDTEYRPSLVAQRLAVTLSLGAGDMANARAWLETHDRWCAWSGIVLERAEGHIAWATYYRAIGDTERAEEHATHALACATEPRQPLALLAAHRVLGELATDAGRDSDARAHLDAALALATACAAPYERALTLLALVPVHLARGETPAAQSLLDEARAICTTLGATPALARADALQARMDRGVPVHVTDTDHLTPREVAVLRLIARGRSNHEIAADLHMSVRTAERHVSNIYGKLHLRTRAEATAYAFQHDLT